MAKFQISHNGGTYEIEAPDEQSALSAFQSYVVKPAADSYVQPAPPPGVTIHNGDGSNTYVGADGKVPTDSRGKLIGNETDAEAKARAARDANGTGSDLAGSVLQGVPFIGGFTSRALAGARSLLGNGDYGSNLTAEQAAENTFAQDHPYQNAAGQIAGGVAGTAMMAPAATAAGVEGALGLGGTTIPGIVGRGAIAGALQGGAAGAGSSSDLTNHYETGGKAAAGAGMGLVAGAAIPAFVGLGAKGVDALANRGTDAIDALSPAAKSYATRFLTDPDTVRLQQQRLNELGSDAVLADTGPEWSAVARGAAAQPGLRGDIVGPLDARDAGKNLRIGQALDSTLGPAPVPSELAAGIKERQAALGPQYDAAIAQADPGTVAPPVTDDPTAGLVPDADPYAPAPAATGAFPAGAGGRAPAPKSLGQFIAENGGLPLDGEAQARDLGKVRTGGRAVAREGGKSVDGFWRTALREAGYFPEDADGYPTSDLSKQIYDALDAEQRGQKLFPINADTGAGGSGADEMTRAVNKAAGDIAKAHLQAGVDPKTLDYGALQDAAQRMARGEETDPLTAYERSVMDPNTQLTGPANPSAPSSAKRMPWEGEMPPEDGAPAPTEGMPGVVARVDAAANASRGKIAKVLRGVRSTLISPITGQPEENPAALFQIRQGLDDQIGAAQAGQKPKLARALMGVRNDIDAQLADTVPGIKDVDAQYAELARQKDAVERGQQLFDSGRTAPRPSEVAQEMANGGLPQGAMVGPSAVPLRLSQGSRAELDRIVGTKANDVSALNQLVKGEGDWNRAKLRSVFGADKADKILAVIDREMQFQNTKNFVVGGSPTAMTAEFAAAQKEAGKPSDLWPKNTTLVGAGGHVLTKGLSLINAGKQDAARRAFAEGLGKLSVAQGPERNAILEALLRRGVRSNNVARFTSPAGAIGAVSANPLSDGLRRRLSGPGGR